MASSRKKRSRAVVTLLLCLAAVCIVAALVLYGLANRKLKALQQGADFEFTYAVTSQGGTTHPALYSILDQAGATEGRMTGLYSPGQLQLYLYSRDAATTETSGDNFFTDVYIDADQTLFNAGKLYRTLRDSVVSSYPLVGTFFPEWSLPNYVSQAQLAQMLGVPDSQVAMQDMSGYTLKLDGQTQDKSDNLVFISFGISEPDVRIYTTVSYVPYTWGRGHFRHTRWVREEETRTKVFFHAGLLLEGCTRAPDGGRGKNLWRTEIRCTGRDDDFRTLLQAMLPVLQQHLGKDTSGRRYFVVTLDEDEAPVVEEKEVTAN